MRPRRNSNKYYFGGQRDLAKQAVVELHFRHRGIGRRARRRIRSGGVERARMRIGSSCIEPCSSHSRIAPAYYSTEIAQPRSARFGRARGSRLPESDQPKIG